MASTTWQETIAPGEADRFDTYAKRLVTLQTKYGGIHRALHAKGHGIYEASLTVGEVPEQARHGLFVRPGKYEALVRFSNGAGKVQPDKTGDVRGIAVKVLGVEGDKILGGANTQDFLAILSPATPFRTADEFMAVIWATRSAPLAMFRLIGALGPIRPFQLLSKLVKGLRMPPASLATTKFYSALPIQCGPHAVRFAFTPVEPARGALTATRDFYTDDLGDRLRRGPLTYTLSLQFFIDEQRTPIEDASVDWDAPYVDVATLSILAQDPASAIGAKLRERGEQLSFDPWHALVEHKPLGGMMRARKVAYFASTQTRKATKEPASIAALLG